MQTKRIDFLDGLRGIAILLVIFYHAYIKWPKSIPFGTEFAHFPLLSQSWLGVQLFFMISGFVILMSLDKSETFLQFASKRWLRLFPAMLMATILILFTLQLLPERPEQMPKWIDALPGLLFVEPGWLHKGVLDGAFWTLFVEVKYYIIFGALYFSIGRKRAIIGLLVFFMIAFIAALIKKYSVTTPPWTAIIYNVSQGLSMDYFAWFTTGSLAYLYYASGMRKYILYAIFTGLLAASAALLPGFEFVKSAYLLVFFFLAVVYWGNLQRFFSLRIFLFFGFISYPLYLIHQNIMVALIVKTSRHLPWIPAELSPILPMVIVIAIAWLIAKYMEKPVRAILQRYVVTPLSRLWHPKSA